MRSARAELALRALEMLANGDSILTHDPTQLRNWATSPQDAVLSLEEIARRILNQEQMWDRESGEA